MSQRRLTLCLLTLLLTQSCAAGDNDNKYDLISDTVAHGVPPGSYTDWLGTEKEGNIDEIIQACSVTCTMAFETPDVPLEVRKGQTDACAYACTYNNLPEDYPSRAGYKTKAIEYYRIATELGSKLPPLL